MPRAIEEIDLSGFDVIISSSHAVGKGIIPPSTAKHICYCHTPMRYAWEMESEYLRDFRVPKFLWKRLRGTLSKLRRWDLSTAKRVDYFIANSQETEKRIQETYGRESTVIPPPIDDRFFEIPLAEKHHRKGFLSVGRLVPYKRLDVLIEAANKAQFPLTVAGKGQEETRLKAMAGPTVRFLGHVPDRELPELYAKAEAVLFAAHEDAGIVPLEAQAMGTPVIAYGKGGATDSVVDGKTGLHFAEQSASSLLEALERFKSSHFDHHAIREHAKKYSGEKFREKMSECIEQCWKKKMS